MTTSAEEWSAGDKVRTGDPRRSGYEHEIVKIGVTEKKQSHDPTKLVAFVRCNDCGGLIELDLDKLSSISRHSMHRRDRITAHKKTRFHINGGEAGMQREDVRRWALHDKNTGREV